LTARATGYCGRCEQLEREAEAAKRKRIAGIMERGEHRHMRSRRAGR
jgi:hypothetical protein